MTVRSHDALQAVDCGYPVALFLKAVDRMEHDALLQQQLFSLSQGRISNYSQCARTRLDDIFVWETGCHNTTEQFKCQDGIFLQFQTENERVNFDMYYMDLILFFFYNNNNNKNSVW